MINLDYYLGATSDHLGVEANRYGRGFWAMALHTSASDFMFDMLTGDDERGLATFQFLQENPLFPAAYGDSPMSALAALDRKLGLLYCFNPREGWIADNGEVTRWTETPQFSLKALCDPEPGNPSSWYDVSWLNIVEDLMESKSAIPYGANYYRDARETCGPLEKRNLHALANFSYDGEWAKLKG